MVDIASAVAVITSVKTAMDIVKQIKDVDVSLEKAEMNLKLAELINALADVKISTAGFQELILEKDLEIKELKDALKLDKEMHYEAPYYWRDTESGKEGPFCQQCHENNNKQIRLQVGYTKGLWKCRTCENSYKDSDYQESTIFASTNTKSSEYPF